MTREDIVTLLQKIKVFYPRFEAVKVQGDQMLVNGVTVNAWFDAVGYISLDEALQTLDKHMESDQANRIPTIGTFKSFGRPANRISCTAVLENGRVRWEPEEGKVYEIPVTWSQYAGAWIDEEGRLWAQP